MRNGGSKAHIKLDAHVQLAMLDVAVGGIDQVSDFGFVDGFHGVKIVVAGACLHLDNVEAVVARFLGHDVDLEMPETPIGFANGVPLRNQEFTGGMFTKLSKFIMIIHQWIACVDLK